MPNGVHRDDLKNVEENEKINAQKKGVHECQVRNPWQCKGHCVGKSDHADEVWHRNRKLLRKVRWGYLKGTPGDQQHNNKRQYDSPYVEHGSSLRMDAKLDLIDATDVTYRDGLLIRGDAKKSPLFEF